MCLLLHSLVVYTIYIYTRYIYTRYYKSITHTSINNIDVLHIIKGCSKVTMIQVNDGFKKNLDREWVGGVNNPFCSPFFWSLFNF